MSHVIIYMTLSRINDFKMVIASTSFDKWKT